MKVEDVDDDEDDIKKSKAKNDAHRIKLEARNQIMRSKYNRSKER